MLPLEPFSLERVAVSWVAWLAAAVGWAAATLWIERDAREVFGRATGWKLAAAALGAGFFLISLSAGALAGVPAAVAVAVCSGGYLVLREAYAAPDDRLVPIAGLADGIRRLLHRSGIERLVQRLRRLQPTPAVSRGGDALVLLKKDGSAYGAARGMDREISEAIKTVQGILGAAIAQRATDVHLEPKADQQVQLRYRIDGMLQNQTPLPPDAGRAVISAIKVVADMDIAEKRRPQDGTFAVLASGHKFDVRANSGPTGFGEKVALRLLDPSGGILQAGLGGLGMRDSMLQSLRSVIQRSNGMLIVCGPTGSGKTTTVYGALSEIDALTRNIVTIEDPIEYRLDNISQTAVNNAADLTFAKILRAVLRQDPDVILVGEIRDQETAEIAMQAALTGHFVFTTLHANDAATTVTRLLDIGIDATLIQSAVTAVLAQRLVRLLCPSCKQAYKPTEQELRRNGMPPDRVPMLFKEQGCTACGLTGYRGRTGIYELLLVDATIRNLLVGRPSIEAIRAAGMRAGMRTLRRSAVYKVAEGLTSLAEIDRVVPEESGRERA